MFRKATGIIVGGRFHCPRGIPLRKIALSHPGATARKARLLMLLKLGGSNSSLPLSLRLTTLANKGK